MRDDSMRVHGITVLATSALLIVAGSAYAVDGVIEINQARALAGSVTPGDAPGFPVQISQPGSYRLTGNLTVPDTNTGAIEIGSSQVSIDLNGFSILGPGTCTGCPVTSCTGGTGKGIYVLSNLENISVRNGTIRGMGSDGILLGYVAQIENVISRDNGGYGIGFVGSGEATINQSHFIANGQSGLQSASASVQGTTVQCNNRYGMELGSGEVADSRSDTNGLDGILMTGDDGGTIANSTLAQNLGCGIRGERTTVVHNSVRSNATCGINVTTSGTLIGNTLDSNGASSSSGKALNLATEVGFTDNVLRNHGCGGSVAVSGGVEIGHNLCDRFRSCTLDYCPSIFPLCPCPIP